MVNVYTIQKRGGTGSVARANHKDELSESIENREFYKNVGTF